MSTIKQLPSHSAVHAHTSHHIANRYLSGENWASIVAGLTKIKGSISRGVDSTSAVYHNRTSRTGQTLDISGREKATLSSIQPLVVERLCPKSFRETNAFVPRSRPVKQTFGATSSVFSHRGRFLINSRDELKRCLSQAELTPYHLPQPRPYGASELKSFWQSYRKKR